MPDVSLSPAPASSKPSRLSISSWFRTRAEPVSSPSSSDIESHSAARSSLVAIYVALLDQHFLEQHVANLHRTGRDIHPAQQLLAEPVHPCRAVQVVHPQLAEVALEVVDDPRQHLVDPVEDRKSTRLNSSH